VQRVIEEIEKGLELIGLTGVEDKLQEKVKPTLEMLRNAGIKARLLLLLLLLVVVVVVVVVVLGIFFIPFFVL